jgi:tetratricopeptide (TPR) repeat protein
MAQATQASGAGQKEQALKLLQQAATTYPTDKAPYLQMAQIKFEGGQYGDAILDAQQVLARDPTDTKANSIVAISGLRLATTALSDLARQNNLSGSLRSESQDLAKLLRESIGEAVLVPPPKARATRPARKAPAKPVAAADDDSADPFGALK